MKKIGTISLKKVIAFLEEIKLSNQFDAMNDNPSEITTYLDRDEIINAMLRYFRRMSK